MYLGKVGIGRLDVLTAYSRPKCRACFVRTRARLVLKVVAEGTEGRTRDDCTLKIPSDCLVILEVLRAIEVGRERIW